MNTFTVGKGKYEGATNAAIQRAVDDAAAAGGGTVIVPPAVYTMNDALHLRSGVRIIGEKGAVLRKAASQESKIPDFLGYGHYEVTVVDPEKFPVGTGIHILDDQSGGFYTTVATVMAREGELLYINRMLNHDYHVKRNARVVSVFPVIEGENAHRASVEGFTLDGNAAEQSMTLNGCRGGAVFLIQCHGVKISNIEAANYRGDSISFQQCTDISVENCHVHHNAGHGLHPGSGSVRYVMQGNRVYDNSGCGLFYCLRTTHSICRKNTLENNGQSGISVGERDTNHLIVENVIRGNAAEGILFRQPDRRSGDQVIIINNVIGPDSAKSARPEIDIPAGLRQIVVRRNQITPAEKCAAIQVAKGCEAIAFQENTVAGRPQQAGDIAGETALVQTAGDVELPPVGPSALPLDGARHLNLGQLRKWEA